MKSSLAILLLTMLFNLLSDLYDYWRTLSEIAMGFSDTNLIGKTLAPIWYKVRVM